MVEFRLVETSEVGMHCNLIISEIKASGMTQEQIAEAIDVSVGTVSELLNGKVIEPKWSRGDALIRLHQDRCQQAA